MRRNARRCKRGSPSWIVNILLSPPRSGRATIPDHLRKVSRIGGAGKSFVAHSGGAVGAGNPAFDVRRRYNDGGPQEGRSWSHRIRTKVEAPPAPAVAEAFYAAAGHIPQSSVPRMPSVSAPHHSFCHPCPTALAATAAPPSALGDSLQPFVDNHTLAGAVVSSPTDKVLDLEAVGFADIAPKTPMRTDDLFWIASMSKPITATALMMLVDEGKVNLDDPVEKYLPEFTGSGDREHDEDHVLLKQPAHPIMVRNVLCHTSGLPFMSAIEHHIDLLPLREAVISYAMTPLQFEPDSHISMPTRASIRPAGSSRW